MHTTYIREIYEANNRIKFVVYLGMYIHSSIHVSFRKFEHSAVTWLFNDEFKASLDRIFTERLAKRDH